MGIGERILHQPHRPGSTGKYTKELLAFSSRLVSTTFLPIPRLALVHSSVACLTLSPITDHLFPLQRGSRADVIHAPFSVRLPSAFIEISLLHVFIETSPPWSFSRKKSETRRSTDPEASRPIDSDHPEPLPVLLSATDFRTSLILPECVLTFSLVTLQPLYPSYFYPSCATIG